ncbi:O-antigen translocase [Vibrio vulnificus]|uniref:O-antigen translocase n=1 Tax=Vibrio vulnificus TaxID=672 RepID=UPI0032F04534
MNLLKTSAMNLLAVIIKMVTMLGINKVLAIYVGPTGYAAFGQFQNAIQMITMLSSGAINNGVVKYTAEYKNDDVKQIVLWRTSGSLVIVACLFSSILILLFAEKLSILFLGHVNFKFVFYMLGVCLTFMVLNTLCLAILNGKREIETYVTCNIVGSILSLVFTVLLSIYFELVGGLIALASYQAVSFIVTFSLIKKKDWFDVSYLFGKVDKKILKKLMAFSIMSVVSAIVVPLSHIFIRDYIGDNLGWDFAGYWEAAWRLSSAYLLLVSSTFSVYFLPRLSELENKFDIRKELKKGYAFIIPFVILGAGAIYIFREIVIKLLFTSSFIPMEAILPYQLVGDVLKCCSVLLGYLVLSKAMTKEYIVSEVLVSVAFYSLVRYFGSEYGLEGLGYAHACTYFIHLCLMYYFVRRKGLV